MDWSSEGAYNNEESLKDEARQLTSYFLLQLHRLMGLVFLEISPIFHTSYLTLHNDGGLLSVERATDD